MVSEQTDTLRVHSILTVIRLSEHGTLMRNRSNHIETRNKLHF